MQQPDPLTPLFASAADVAKLLSISERHLWALHSAGRVPRPVALGRARRWNVDELREWARAGAPTRDMWEQRQERQP